MDNTVTPVQFTPSKVSPWTRFARSSQEANTHIVTRASLVSKRPRACVENRHLSRAGRRLTPEALYSCPHRLYRKHRLRDNAAWPPGVVPGSLGRPRPVAAKAKPRPTRTWPTVEISRSLRPDGARRGGELTDTIVYPSMHLGNRRESINDIPQSSPLAA